MLWLILVALCIALCFTRDVEIIGISIFCLALLTLVFVILSMTNKRMVNTYETKEIIYSLQENKPVIGQQGNIKIFLDKNGLQQTYLGNMGFSDDTNFYIHTLFKEYKGNSFYFPFADFMDMEDEIIKTLLVPENTEVKLFAK